MLFNNKDLKTPLFIAAQSQENDIIKTLTKNGASIDITTTKEFNLQQDENPVILKEGSTVMTLMNVIKQWRDSMDQNLE